MLLNFVTLSQTVSSIFENYLTKEILNLNVNLSEKNFFQVDLGINLIDNWK